MATLTLNGSTSGNVVVTVPAISGTGNTVTIPAATGTLALASTSTSGGIFFGGATSGVLYQDASNLYWDDTNNALGIGTNSPNTYGSVAVYKTGADSRQVIVADNSNSYDPTLAFLRTGVTAWNIGIDQADGSSFKISNSGTYDISTGTCIKVEGTTGNTTVSGTLTTGSRGIAKASMPAGSVIQVVQGTLTSTVSTTSTSLVDTGLTASITPTSSTSKILIIVNHNGIYNGGVNNAAFTALFRGASSISTISAEAMYLAGSGVSAAISADSIAYLDSPATTSSTTYKTQFKSTAGSQVSVCRSNSISMITLMEIAV